MQEEADECEHSGFEAGRLEGVVGRAAAEKYAVKSKVAGSGVGRWAEGVVGQAAALKRKVESKLAGPVGLFVL